MTIQGIPISKFEPFDTVEIWHQYVCGLKAARVQGHLTDDDFTAEELGVLRLAYAAVYAWEGWQDECARERRKNPRNPVIPTKPEWVPQKLLSTLRDWNRLQTQRHGGKLVPEPSPALLKRIGARGPDPRHVAHGIEESVPDVPSDDRWDPFDAYLR